MDRCTIAVAVLPRPSHQCGNDGGDCDESDDPSRHSPEVRCPEARSKGHKVSVSGAARSLLPSSKATTRHDDECRVTRCWLYGDRTVPDLFDVALRLHRHDGHGRLDHFQLSLGTRAIGDQISNELVARCDKYLALCDPQDAQ